MFDKKFINFLDKNLGRVLPEYRKKYSQYFFDLDFNKKNEDFVTFWSNYNDEIPAQDGFLPPFCDQLIDFENSISSKLRKDFELPENFYSLFNFEFDDYMFYDKNTDEVYLVLAPDLKDFINLGLYEKKWDSFSEFIKYQLEYYD